MWLIVTAIKRGDHTRQREIAGAVGLEDATLTHHLHRMEQAGLIVRHREPTNRRNQIVTLTADGDALFDQMLSAVRAFDLGLRRGLTTVELRQLRSLLDRLRTNATSWASVNSATAPRARPSQDPG